MTGAEKSYCPQQERHKRVLEGAEQSFWDWDLKTNEFWISHSYATMLGYAPEEIPGHDDSAIQICPEEWTVHVHPDDLAKAWESIERHLQGLTASHNVELRCKTKSEEWKWLLVTGRVVERDETGKPLFMSGIHTDITVRKQAEEELRRSEERFRIALQNSQVTVFEQDLELRYTYNHRPFFGYSPEQVIGKRDRDLIEPACAARLEAVKQSVIDTETPLREEVSLIASDGRREHFDLYAEPKRDQTGKVVGIICTAVDITARIKMEERERRLTNIFHALSETNGAILRLKSPDELFPSICRIAVQYGGMTHAWIGIPDSDGRFAAAGEYGKFTAPPNSLKLTAPANPITVLSTPNQPEGRGPSGIAFRENRTVVVNNILGDERLAPWHERARRDGTNSMAVFPIVRNGHPYGVFSVYSDQVGAFDGEIVTLLGGMVNNLSFALDSLEHETLLRQSESRFRQLAGAMPQLVWTANPDGEVDYYNDRLYEYRTDFTINEKGIFEWVRIVHPDDVDASASAWEHAVQSGEAYEVEQRVLRADGAYHWHITRATPIRNEHGQITKWFGTSTDIHELKSAQQALIEGEERLRNIFENAGDSILIIDRFQRIIDANASGAKTFGYPLEELRKLNVRDILTEHDRGRVPDNWEGWDIAANAVSTWTFRRKDASTFEGEVNSRSLPDGRFMGILRDVTERNRILAFLEEKEALLSLFIKNTPAAVAMFDRQMRYLATSKRFIEDYHLTGKEVIGRSHYDVFPDIPDRWREFHRRGLAGETIRMDEDRFDRADGSMEWVLWEIKPWYSGNTVEGILLFSEVITGRKKADEEKDRLSEQRQLALDAGSLGSWHYDTRTGAVTYDERYEQIYGLTGKPAGIESILARFHPDDKKQMLETIRAAINTINPRPFEVEARIVLDDGSVRWLRTNGIATFEGEGEALHVTSVTGTVADVTSNKEAQEAAKLAAKLYMNSSEAMIVLDDDYKIIMVNPAFTDITGYESADVIGKDPDFLRTNRHDDAYYDNIRTQVHTTGHFKGEVWQRRKNGQDFAAQLTINIIYDEAGTPHRHVALLSDITEKKRSDELIWSQANFDALTGLPNRRFFRDRLEHEIRGARRSKLSLALLLIDLDGFKHVNDALGHDTGDLLLKEVADRLCRCVRETDTVARLGGDEFTVILPGLHDADNVDRVARHILQELSVPIRLGQEIVYIAGSIGITLFPDDTAEVEELIRNADLAMYAAKQNGKNRYHYFTPAMQEDALRRIRIINDLRGA